MANRRTKIKKILKKSGAHDPFQSSFMENMNVDIIKAKLVKMDKLVANLVSLETKLLDYYYKNFNDYSANAKELLEMLEDFSQGYTNDKNQEKQTAVGRYKSFKKSKFLNHIIKTCEYLIVHKDSLSNKTNLDVDFIFNYPGNEVQLIYGWQVDFKQLLYYDPSDFNKFATEEFYEKTKQYTLLSCCLLLKTSLGIYDVIVEPDVDIESFVSTVLTAVEDLEKRIPRCKEAFQKLKGSVGMLKKNFNGYYKDYMQTGSKGSILTEFVQDLINNNKADLQLVRQFREIMKYLNKAYQSMPQKNKEIDQLLKNLNNFSDIIEKNNDKPEEIIAASSSEAGNDASNDAPEE